MAHDSLREWFCSAYARRWAICLAIPIVANVGCQSPEVQWDGSHQSQNDWPSFGELVFEVIQRYVATTDDCVDPRMGALWDRRDTVVGSVDLTVPPDLVGSIPETVSTSLLPLVDSGELPQLTDTAADVLGLLIADDVDPNREALQAILSTAETPTVLQSEQVTSFARVLLDDPIAKDWLHALTRVARASDGDDHAIATLLALVREQLDSVAAPSTCEGLTLGELEHTMLAEHPPPDRIALGVPAWVVRTDANRRPRVRTDPATGLLYEPFVDRDGDGIADTNPNGHPVDRNGQVIDRPAFSNESAHDSDGRALAHDGRLLYDYFDAKRTGLSYALQLLGDALRTGVHHDLANVVEHAVGPQRWCSDCCDGGTLGCPVYPSEDNALADLVFTLLEIARYDRVSTFLQTWDELVEGNQELAERVLVSMGQVLEALSTERVALTDPDVLDLIAAAMPLVDDIFEVDNTAGGSTPRLLVQAIHDLGQVARDFPAKLELTVNYQSLHKEQACTDSGIDVARSVPVSYEQPRWIPLADGSWQDNRSALEQSIELLAAADCGNLPLADNTVAGLLIELLAQRDAETVCNLIDLFLDVLGIPLSEWLAGAVLDVIGCDGDAVMADIRALDALAKSGALDTYLPLAKVFVERGQVRTLLDIFHLVRADLTLDEDGDPQTRSQIRRALPVIERALRSGAVDSLFDLDDVLVTVPAIDGSGTVVDVMIDSIARLADDDGTVLTRHGPRTETSLALQTLTPLKTLVSHLARAGERHRFDAVVDHLGRYLTGTVVDDAGTSTPEDDTVRLADPRLLPLLGDTLGTAIDVFDLPQQTRDCHISRLQADAEAFITGPSLASLARLLRLLERSEEREVLEQGIARLLQPNVEQPEREFFGPLLRMAASLLQTPPHTADLRRILAFASVAMEPQRLEGEQLLATFDKVLASDPHDTLLTVLRNALSHPVGAPYGDTPVASLGEVFSDVASIRGEPECNAGDDLPWDVAGAQDVVEALLEFMRDDEMGLGAIYSLIGMRVQEQASYHDRR